MKKTILSIVVLLSLLFLTSCDKNKEVRQFAIDFAAAVQSGNKSEITKMYPDAAKADSLSFAFDAEKAEIETLDDGSIKIALSDDIDIILAKNDGDGNLKVKASHGVFAYPSDRLELAKKSGQWKDGLNDIEQTERLADTLFLRWMQAKMVESMKSLVKITNSSVSSKHVSNYNIASEEERCSYTVTVANNTDQEIEGNDYTISVKETWYLWKDGWEDMSFRETKHPESSTKTLTGKPIPAKGTATYTWNETFAGSHHFGYSNFGVQSTLNYTPKQSDFNFKYTGKEYEEYLSQKSN